MWLFTDFGYLLPTITFDDDPMRSHEQWDHYSVGGQFTFQIRARLREHLEYYLANFAEEGTYGDIWATPDHDYNFRVFTTQEAFAAATAKMVMAIDYRHFKDESTKYPRGHEYHKLLLDVWQDSAELGDGPGGFYGPWSPENPKGYRRARQYNGWGWADYEGRRVGDTFEGIDFGDEDEQEDSWYMDPRFDDAENEDLPDDERKARELIEEMERYGVSMEDWHLNMLPSEFETVIPALRQSFGKKKVKRWRAENLRNFVL